MLVHGLGDEGDLPTQVRQSEEAHTRRAPAANDDRKCGAGYWSLLVRLDVLSLDQSLATDHLRSLHWSWNHAGVHARDRLSHRRLPLRSQQCTRSQRIRTFFHGSGIPTVQHLSLQRPGSAMGHIIASLLVRGSDTWPDIVLRLRREDSELEQVRNQHGWVGTGSLKRLDNELDSMVYG